MRVFKTGWFTKAARKARISDSALCAASHEIIDGRASNLGGGVFKMRLNKNLHRAVVLAKGGQNWIFVFLFAKNDRANIDSDQLAQFRNHAKDFERITSGQLTELLQREDLIEICETTEEA